MVKLYLLSIIKIEDGFDKWVGFLMIRELCTCLLSVFSMQNPAHETREPMLDPPIQISISGPRGYVPGPQTQQHVPGPQTQQTLVEVQIRNAISAEKPRDVCTGNIIESLKIPQDLMESLRTNPSCDELVPKRYAKEIDKANPNAQYYHFKYMFFNEELVMIQGGPRLYPPVGLSCLLECQIKQPNFTIKAKTDTDKSCMEDNISPETISLSIEADPTPSFSIFSVDLQFRKNDPNTTLFDFIEYAKEHVWQVMQDALQTAELSKIIPKLKEIEEDLKPSIFRGSDNPYLDPVIFRCAELIHAGYNDLNVVHGYDITRAKIEYQISKHDQNVIFKFFPGTRSGIIGKYELYLKYIIIRDGNVLGKPIPVTDAYCNDCYIDPEPGEINPIDRNIENLERADDGFDDLDFFKP